MTKALIKKELMEIFSWVFLDRKSGKKRSVGSLVLFGVLYLYVFGILGFTFYMLADTLCAPLSAAGFGWLYIALISLVALALGVFGSVFNTYSALYQPKDNELLLSMPIPVRKILGIRLAGVYFSGLMFELIVMVPALIVWFINGAVSPAGILFSLLVTIVLSILILVLSCILGWAVAYLSSKVKNKNFITVLLSLIFIVLYYYCYSKVYDLLQNILMNPMEYGKSVKTGLYPFYHMGLAAEGNALSMLIVIAIAGVLFAATYYILSRSFLKIATSNKGAAKAVYKSKPMKATSVSGALFRKELRRFLGSATYMLNCGMGVIMILVAAGAFMFKGKPLVSMFQMLLGNSGILPMAALAMICMVTSMNTISAPSVSLEGKHIWLVQSLPVPASQVLLAKLKLHMVLTVIPSMVLVACVEWIIRPSLPFALLIPAATLVFISFMALLGICVNLKTPNLNWTSEAVPVKQSIAVMVALLGGWAIIVAFGILYYFLAGYITPLAYTLCVTILLSIISGFLFNWMKTKGAEIFKNL